MTQSVAQAANKILTRMKRARKLAEPVVGAAHNVVQGALPVYTGTYQDAVMLGPVTRGDAKGLALSVTHESLMRSASSHAGDIRSKALPHDSVSPEHYAYGYPSKDDVPFALIPGGSPYISRIEQIGSPLGYGQGVWGNAIQVARKAFHDGFQRAVGGAA